LEYDNDRTFKMYIQKCKIQSILRCHQYCFKMHSVFIAHVIQHGILKSFKINFKILILEVHTYEFSIAFLVFPQKDTWCLYLLVIHVGTNFIIPNGILGTSQHLHKHVYIGSAYFIILWSINGNSSKNFKRQKLVR